jgi:YD repeat-containing protein
MKNALGKNENLKLFNEQGKMVYSYSKGLRGVWYECTYDENGYVLTCKNSYGYWEEYTYDKKGNILTYKDSSGNWKEYTYDEKGNELTYKNSNGTERGFNIPEYTMKELVEKIRNFKLVKKNMV